ncbi:unnamed protein product [Effrenium voratum]|nr:unnamed protein product [Effrenium voratum]
MPLEADAKKELEEAIKGASSGTLVQGTQRVYGVLQKHGLLRRQVVQPGLVGCHRDNRDGFGLSVKDVSELITAIKEVGFDHGAINAVAVELSPDDELTFQFNEKLARDSGYMLPSVPRHQLKFASLAGSHTNAALRLIAAGAEHTDGDLCVRGRLALEQVRQVDAEFARAVDEGCGKFQRAAGKGYCAGAPGMLQRSESFIKAHAVSGRQLGADFFENLSLDTKPPTANQCLMFRHALLRLAYSVPVEKFVTAADAKKMHNRDVKAKVDMANSFMQKASQLPQSSQVPSDPAISSCFLACEHELVLIALDKRHRDINCPSTMEAAMCKLCDLVEKASGIRMTTEWDKFKEAAAQASATAVSSVASTQLREFSSDGTLKQQASLLREEGFVEGQYLQRKTDKIVARIVAMEGEKVTLAIEDGMISGKAQVSVSALLSKQWKKIQPPQEAEELTEFRQQTAKHSPEVRLTLAKADILKKLVGLEEKHCAVYKALKVMFKPQKAVIATHAFEAGWLVLVPVSMKIDAKPIEQDGGQSAVCLGRVKGSDVFWLQPCFIPDKGDGRAFVAPFWFVRSTNEQSEANCALTDEVERDFKNTNIKVPLLKSTRRIEAGEQLRCYVPKQAKRVEVEELIALHDPEPPAKRRRHKQAE